MRLTDKQRKVIHDAVVDLFGRDATVQLFGSRADDRARGGDIDLLIKTSIADVDKLARAEVAFQARLERTLGAQKVDVLIDFPGRAERPLILREAERTGIPL